MCQTWSRNTTDKKSRRNTTSKLVKVISPAAETSSDKSEAAEQNATD